MMLAFLMAANPMEHVIQHPAYTITAGGVHVKSPGR